MSAAFFFEMLGGSFIYFAPCGVGGIRRFCLGPHSRMTDEDFAALCQGGIHGNTGNNSSGRGCLGSSTEEVVCAFTYRDPFYKLTDSSARCIARYCCYYSDPFCSIGRIRDAGQVSGIHSALSSLEVLDLSGWRLLEVCVVSHAAADPPFCGGTRPLRFANQSRSSMPNGALHKVAIAQSRSLSIDHGYWSVLPHQCSAM